MNTNEVRRYEMLQRVQKFGETHRELFPASETGGEAMAAVAAAVRQLSEQAVSKVTTAQGGKRAKALARRALTLRLEAVRRSARAIAEDDPGFDDPFQMPRSRSAQALLIAGRAFVREAEARKERFLAYRSPETFVTSLSVLVDALEQAIHSREAGRDGVASARAGIQAALASGFAAIRKLDVIVVNQLQDDPMTLAVWERDRRVDYSRRVRKAASPPPDTPAAGEPAPAVAAGQPVRVAS